MYSATPRSQVKEQRRHHFPNVIRFQSSCQQTPHQLGLMLTHSMRWMWRLEAQALKAILKDAVLQDGAVSMDLGERHVNDFSEKRY